MSETNLLFFPSAAVFRQWLEKNSTSTAELWVGFYKTGCGKPSVTWPESVDEALCFGWIDGLRKSIDAESYKIRFTPRRPRSVWSAVNIKRVAELTELGRMRPAGVRAFEARIENRSGTYSYEHRSAELPAPYAEILRTNEKAWTFFQAQPPSYRKTMFWFVLSAKTEATRLKRLNKLIEESANGRRMG